MSKVTDLLREMGVMAQTLADESDEHEMLGGDVDEGAETVEAPRRDPWAMETTVQHLVLAGTVDENSMTKTVHAFVLFSRRDQAENAGRWLADAFGLTFIRVIEQP